MEPIAKLARGDEIYQNWYIGLVQWSKSILTLRRAHRDQQGGCLRLTPAIALRLGRVRL